MKNLPTFWLFNILTPSTVVLPGPWVQGLFCRCIHCDWAPSFCSVTGCGFL